MKEEVSGNGKDDNPIQNSQPQDWPCALEEDLKFALGDGGVIDAGFIDAFPEFWDGL